MITLPFSNPWRVGSSTQWGIQICPDSTTSSPSPDFIQIYKQISTFRVKSDNHITQNPAPYICNPCFMLGTDNKKESRKMPQEGSWGKVEKHYLDEYFPHRILRELLLRAVTEINSLKLLKNFFKRVISHCSVLQFTYLDPMVSQEIPILVTVHKKKK